MGKLNKSSEKENSLENGPITTYTHDKMRKQYFNINIVVSFAKVECITGR